MDKMMRKIIFYLAVIFFVFVTPIIIAYALGYGLDWKSKKIVLSGGLSIQSIPKKATVLINNDPQKEKTPVLIKHLIPKYYQITITKEGYHTWQKNIEIKSELITEIKDVLLIQTQPNLEILDSNLSSNFSLDNFLNPDNFEDNSNSLFYFQSSNNILYKTDSTGLKSEQISLIPLPENQTYKLIAPDDQHIVLLGKNNTKLINNNIFDLYIFNPSTRNFDLVSNNVKFVQFSNDHENVLYVANNELWVFHFHNTLQPDNATISKKELVTRSSKPIEQAIWYIKDDKHIIFTVDSLIKIIELDERDKRNIVDIIKSPVEQINYDLKSNKLYWVTENKLLSLSLD